MILEHLLQQLQNTLSLTVNTQKDPKGFYHLALHPELVVQLKSLDPGFYLRSIIKKAPDTSNERTYLYLMRANFLGQGTQGAALGLDTQEMQYILAKRYYEDMNFRQFKDEIETFVNYLDYWMKKIPELEKQNDLTK